VLLSSQSDNIPKVELLIAINFNAIGSSVGAVLTES